MKVLIVTLDDINEIGADYSQINRPHMREGWVKTARSHLDIVPARKVALDPSDFRGRLYDQILLPGGLKKEEELHSKVISTVSGTVHHRSEAIRYI